jgi:hypothetical protein
VRHPTSFGCGLDWITPISCCAEASPDGAALALEPNANPAGTAFQEAMFAHRIPAERSEHAHVAELK